MPPSAVLSAMMEKEERRRRRPDLLLLEAGGNLEEKERKEKGPACLGGRGEKEALCLLWGEEGSVSRRKYVCWGGRPYPGGHLRLVYDATSAVLCSAFLFCSAYIYMKEERKEGGRREERKRKKREEKEKEEKVSLCCERRREELCLERKGRKEEGGRRRRPYVSLLPTHTGRSACACSSVVEEGRLCYLPSILYIWRRCSGEESGEGRRRGEEVSMEGGRTEEDRGKEEERKAGRERRGEAQRGGLSLEKREKEGCCLTSSLSFLSVSAV